MTTKRTGDSWMSPDDYGRALPFFTVNLLVTDLRRSTEFYTNVLGATLIYSDSDFAALRLKDLEFMLHADHAYDHHPWHKLLAKGERRGLGAELRLFHTDPDAVESRARRHGVEILQASQDKPHGWRDVIVADPDGYAWAVGIPLQK
jgi:catechol 2,3-dioxygenase-like lactoylglutathione lyase family enzyme